MILTGIIIWLIIGGFLAWFSERWGEEWPRWISLITLGTHMIALIVIWIQYLGQINLSTTGTFFLEHNILWIPQAGINLHFAMDGFSLLLILLANFLGLVAVATSWTEIQFRVGFFHFNLLWIMAALVGIFLAVDLFLFYFFWEMLLIPLYLLIGIWGHERRIYASIKFFIFTQAGGLFMLLAILALYFIHGANTGVYTFDYKSMIGTAMSPTTATWLMLGFFAAFAVKLPVVPLHTWLPDAHTQAPTAGSVDLAGLVLKIGAFGMIRYLFPLFPQASHNFAPYAMALGVAGILYGAILAFGQTNIKRLVAYTSISHMGFVLIGIFAWNQIALQGAVMIMVAHGISTGGLFVLVGNLYERTHTRDMYKMGGLWGAVPRMGRSGLVLALASLGLPGLGNFVGEFLVLLGTYKVNPVMAILATLGFIVATVYSLLMIQKIFNGPSTLDHKISDFNFRELTVMTTMILILFWLGLYPQTVLETSKSSMELMQKYANIPRQALNTKPSSQSANQSPLAPSPIEIQPVQQPKSFTSPP